MLLGQGSTSIHLNCALEKQGSTVAAGERRGYRVLLAFIVLLNRALRSSVVPQQSTALQVRAAELLPKRGILRHPKEAVR